MIALLLRRVAPRGDWIVWTFLLVWLFGIILPIAGVILSSFVRLTTEGQPFEFTLTAYWEILETGRWEVTARTIRISATVTLITLMISFPFALWLAKGVRSPVVQLVTWTLLTAPFFLSATARTIIWRPILGLHGPINTALISLGITDAPITWLLFSEPAVHFGLIGPYLPNMIWPIFLSMSLIDDEYLEASKDIGATPWQTLRHIVIPLSLPGVLAGIVFTFVPMLGDDVVPKLLGGQQVAMLGNAMLDLVTARNYTVAAAMSTLVLMLILFLQFLLVIVLRRIGGTAPILEGIKR